MVRRGADPGSDPLTRPKCQIPGLIFACLVGSLGSALGDEGTRGEVLAGPGVRLTALSHEFADTEFNRAGVAVGGRVAFPLSHLVAVHGGLEVFVLPRGGVASTSVGLLGGVTIGREVYGSVGLGVAVADRIDDYDEDDRITQSSVSCLGGQLAAGIAPRLSPSIRLLIEGGVTVSVGPEYAGTVASLRAGVRF